MTPEEFARRMQECVDMHDEECGHDAADDLMCELLKQLGYEKGVELFEKMPKWYA